MIIFRDKLKLSILVMLAICAASAFAQANENDPKIGDGQDGSLTDAVHKIKLYDEQGSVIYHDDEPLMPFSTRQTCDRCHNYEQISKGWHFNAGNPDIDPGRPGQPWILTDAKSGTQIPLSLRDWPRTFLPSQIGLTNRRFLEIFGRHLPGGGIGEIPETDDPDEMFRWDISGVLEINCLSCHDAEPAHDQAEFGSQTLRDNFRWAAAATCAFASVRGNAKKMEDTFDPLMGELPDDPKQIANVPSVSYDPTRFNTKGEVFFDIAWNPPANRCYFCHSTYTPGDNQPEMWAHDRDVHIAAGLTCTDCHRNGLDHNITRGYEAEHSMSDNPYAASLSCEGCHIDDESNKIPLSGRLGAPEPKHAGIAKVHFQKLSCTACHSGPWPSEYTGPLKTSIAHNLGGHNVNKSKDALPHILSPVYITGPDGKISPHNLIWPAFWARLEGENVVPVNLDMIKKTARKIFSKNKRPKSGDWPALNNEQITDVLKLLSAEQSPDGLPVYISGGKLHRLDDAGLLTEQEHPSAEPYAWPLAHNVRPATQALGVRACEDCHSTEAALFFGNVTIDSPLAADRSAVKIMHEFQDVDPVYIRLFALSFNTRPILKIVSFTAAAVLLIVLIYYPTLPGSSLKDQWKRLGILRQLLMAVTIIAFLILAFNGFILTLISGHGLTGYPLMVQCIAGGVFAFCFAVLAVAGAHLLTSDKFARACLWLIILLVLVVILSITISMFNIFSSDSLELLHHLHRISAAMVVITVIVFASLLFKSRKCRRD